MWKPNSGEMYWIPMPHLLGMRDWFLWSDDDIDRRYFERGLVCKTEEEACERAKLMIQVLSVVNLASRGSEEKG